jgi:hypothetical protein
LVQAFQSNPNLTHFLLALPLLHTLQKIAALKVVERALAKLFHFFTASQTGVSGLPDFSWYNIPKRGKIYQSTTKYTKWTQNMYTKWTEHLPNGHKIYQHLPLQDPPKFTQIGILGLKIYHLATLPSLAKVHFSPALRYLHLCTYMHTHSLTHTCH